MHSLRSLVSVLAGLTLAGCGASDPSELPIMGIWGGAQLELVATGNGAEARLPCGVTVALRSPIIPDADGRFQRRGVARGFNTEGPVAIDGQVAGPWITIDLRYGDESELNSYVIHAQLRRGARADFSDLICAH